jgi:hypothetical protein
MARPGEAELLADVVTMLRHFRMAGWVQRLRVCNATARKI